MLAIRWAQVDACEDDLFFSNFYVQRAIISRMARVLVVDDEPAVRRALERALRLDSYDVELAADGEEALDALGPLAPPTRSSSTC